MQIIARTLHRIAPDSMASYFGTEKMRELKMSEVPHGHIVESSFRPHPLLRNPHLQTIFAALCRPTPALPMRRERWELPDGDFVDLGWSGEHNVDGPIAVLVHGVTGGFQSKYLRGTARRLNANGWRTVALQLRGGGDEPNRLPHMYHHGDTQDLRQLLHLLRAREPHTPLAAIGWSLGGNVVLKALAEEGDKAPVNAAAAASVPFEIKPCAEHMRNGFSRIYRHNILSGLKRSVRRKAARMKLPSAVRLEAALATRDFFEFDDALTAPLCGFRDAVDYYTQAACGQYLKAIRRPTLIVHALDDPFMVPSIVPRADQLAPTVTLELATAGGHVGFVGAGPGGLPQMWLEQRLTRYLLECVPTAEASAAPVPVGLKYQEV